MQLGVWINEFEIFRSELFSYLHIYDSVLNHSAHPNLYNLT